MPSLVQIGLVIFGMIPVLLISAPPAADDERQYQALLQTYRADEARLPRMIHYQRAVGGPGGESLRADAWLGLDGVLSKVAREKRGPRGSELVETSLHSAHAYFQYRRVMTLQADGGVRITEERRYWHASRLIRRATRDATFPPNVDMDIRAVRQEVLPLTGLAEAELSPVAAGEEAADLLASLRVAGPPQYDPAAEAGPDWRRIRLIKDTASPNGRYQLAWAPAEPVVDWAKFRGPGESFRASPETRVQNFLFDLETLTIAAEVPSRHRSTEPVDRDFRVQALWSPDAKCFVVLTANGWKTTGCVGGRLSDGKFAGAGDLSEPIEVAVAQHLAARKDRAWGRYHAEMATSFQNLTVANDGTVSLTFGGQVPKSTAADARCAANVKLRLAKDGRGIEPKSLVVSAARP